MVNTASALEDAAAAFWDDDSFYLGRAMSLRGENTCIVAKRARSTYRFCKWVEVREPRATEERSRIHQVRPRLKLHGVELPL